MPGEEGGTVISLDSRRLLVLGVVAVLCVVATYSYIAALFAFIAPSQDFPLDVTGVETLNTAGNPQTIFGKGSTVRVRATVEMATGYYYFPPYYYDFVGDVQYRIIVAVMDGGRSPVFIQSTTKTISLGASQETSFDYAISSGAASGTYTIRVVVWSDWLPGGVALAPSAGNKTFQVT